MMEIFLFISENYTESFYLLFYEHFFFNFRENEGVKIRKVKELQG